ncbi:MAG: SDR family NAD(P)-dependent oxidoreductase [Sulfitobacter sp.]
MNKHHQINKSGTTASADFAIVGIGCRLPGGVNSADSYWKLLQEGRCGIREIPEDRWGIDSFYDPDQNMVGRSVSKWAGFIDGVRDFDPAFFGLSPREASAMDPQQRLVLQTSFEAMEDAGIPTTEFSKSRTGVFVGIQTSDYREVQQQRTSGVKAYGGTSLALCIVANRVSHRLNLRGPSYAVDTACSSSLTAMNQAILNLKSDQCDLAIVSGVNLLLSPMTFVAFSKAGMLSPTGTLSTFDANANGFVRGEGVGTIVLKPYDRALADGDRIYAVVEGSQANQDGFTSTITAPNQTAQIDMLQSLISQADVTPDMVGFVEAHGTGTPIGDPIEAGAIGRVLGQHKTNGPLMVGSVKPSIGHLESGAGVNGLIKVALSIYHGEVPRNINFKDPNPRIPFDALNLEVPTKAVPFPEFDGIKRGIVNSFGFGGANASALLRSPSINAVEGVYRKPIEREIETAPWLFPISAQSEESLKNLALNLAQSLRKGGQLAKTDLGEVAAALGMNRTHRLHRAVVLAKDRKTLLRGLDYIGAGDPDAETPEFVVTGQATEDRKLCFMFAGQGSQWWAMARSLLQHNKVFQNTVDAYDAEFRKAAGWSIKEELLRAEADSRIDDTTVTQPALFAIQAGLSAVWKSWGIVPDMVTGHSIGEAAAAYVAGGLSLKGAARFLSKRGAIRDELGAKGAMAAIGLSVDEVEALLPDHGLINIAAINGPGSTTITGDYDAIHTFVEQFQTENPNVLARTLRVDTAWHSYQLERGEDWFRKEVAQIDWSVPSIPFISTVTGCPETKFDTDYGWSNLRQPVNFQGGIECALSMGASVFVELGPHTTLSGPATSTAANSGASVEIINSLHRKSDDFTSMARAAARLFVGGSKLDWSAVNGEPSRHIALPSYPWQNDSYWSGSEEWQESAFSKPTGAFLGNPVSGAKSAWMSDINLQAFPFIGEHRLQSECVFPGAGYMEIMFEAARYLFEDGVIEVENMQIHEALFIPSDSEVRFWTEYVAERDQIKIYTQTRETGEDWVLRAQGRVRMNDLSPQRFSPLKKDDDEAEEYSIDLLYLATSDDGIINYGPAFQTVRDLWASDSQTAARVSIDPNHTQGFEMFQAHPALLDGCLQISDPRMSKSGLEIDRESFSEAFMPIGAMQIRLHKPLPPEFFVYARHLDRLDAVTGLTNFVITDLDDNVVMEVNGLLNRSVHGNALKEHAEGFSPHYVVESFSELRLPPEEDDAPSLGRWLVFEGRDAQSQGVISELKSRGADVTCLHTDDLSWDEMSDDIADHLSGAVEQGELEGILYLRNLEAEKLSLENSAQNVSEALIHQSKCMIALAAGLDEVRYLEKPPRFVLVTRNGRLVSEDEAMPVDGLLQTPLVALLRTIANEVPEVRFGQIDADDLTLNTPKRILSAIVGMGNETEIALRENGDFAARLNRVWPEEMPARNKTIAQDDPNGNFCVTMDTAGVIDNLEIVECPLEDIGADEVRVRVAAVGLNFRDVMAVTGLLPREAEGEPAWRNLGLEFSGTIVAVGQNVKTLAIGDRVMGMGKRCLQRFLTMHHSVLARIPEHVSMEEAATIPSAFATAHYTLNRVGRLSQGEKVLIHVATGGVGTAAVQMAKNAGAEIFATAGSPEKRALLKKQGIKHVMNSRDLSFADEIMRKTDGRGVDVVLNSLPGPFIDKGIEVLAPYGRFLEIGKRDVYEDNSIGMKALRRNISLSVLDLAAMGVERPDMLGEMFHEINEAFVKRDLEALPFDAFPVHQVSDAIRFMSQARHVGKVVVTFDQEAYQVKASDDRDVSFEQKGAYLVTGGNGGFGLSIAAWMARSGAGKMVLASRSGKIPESDAATIEEIKAAGTKVELVSLDITSQEDTDALIARLFDDKQYPLKGVLHAAAIFSDGLVAQLTDEMIAEVIKPKVGGAWCLQKAFEKAGRAPDFMIGFSSIASTTGAMGQANYVTANAFLDGLATYRRQFGDIGGAINWGPIAETGQVGRNDELTSYFESMGLRGLTPEETPDGVETLLRKNLPSFTYVNANWEQMGQTNATLASNPRVAGLLKKQDDKSSELRDRLMLLEGEELIDEITQFVKREIGNVLKIDPEQIETSTAMNGLGLDSLSSFELKMRIELAMGTTLQVARFLQAHTISDLIDVLAEEVDRVKLEDARTKANEEDQDTSGSTALETINDVVLSDRGHAILRECVAPMTSAAALRAFEHHIGVEISPGVDDKTLKKAVNTVSKRHRLMSCRLTQHSPNADLTYDGAMIATKVDDVFALNSLEPLNPVEAVARVYWSTDASDKTHLILQVSAGVTDRIGAQVIVEDLLNRISGKPLKRVMSKSKLATEMRRRIYDAEQDHSQNDHAYWHYVIGENAPALPFEGRSRALLPAALGRNHGPAIERKTEQKISDLTETEFVLAFADALVDVTGHADNILLTRKIARPEHLLSTIAVAPFDCDQPIYVPMDGTGETRHRFVSSLLTHANDHDSMDLFSLCAAFKEQFDAMDAFPFQIGYLFKECSNGAEVSPKDRFSNFGDYKIVPKETGCPGLAHDVLVEVTCKGSHVECVVRVDRDVLGPDEVDRLVQALTARLIGDQTTSLRQDDLQVAE